MKKMCAVVVIMSIFINSFFIKVYCSNLGISYSEWMDDNGNYIFPITHYDPEWYEFESVIEMREATQLPENILDNISTNNLIQMILDYPLLCDLNAFSTLKDGYEHVKAQFNGINELLSREDAYEQLLNAYIEINLPKTKLIDYESIINSGNMVSIFNDICNGEMRAKLYEDANVIDSINILEYMILDLIENNTLYLDDFMNVYLDKAEQKLMSDYFININEYSLLTSISQETSIFSENTVLTNTLSDSTSITIYTPSGTSVSVEYSSTLEMCDTSQYLGLIAEYNASLVSGASKTFNCHSFAWLNDLRSDYQHIWLDNVNAFCSDPYYEMSYTVQQTSIAYFNYGAHSAIVIDISDDPNDNVNSPQGYCLSKWGVGPMVSHYVKCCPYYLSDSTMRYYTVAD